MPTTSLPHRFRYEVVRRYEGDIAQIVEAKGNVVKFDPSLRGLSSTTFSCRLRDAMNAYLIHHWPAVRFDMVDLVRLHPTLQVKDKGHEVWVGTPQAFTALAALDEEPSAQRDLTADPVEYPNEPDDMELHAICFLASKRAFRSKILVPLTPIGAKWCEEHYDVVVEEKSPGMYYIS